MTGSPIRAAERMTPVDAMWLWFASKFHSDQFLLYAFDGTADPASTADELVRRARTCPDLGRRVLERPLMLGYPYWVSDGVAPEQVVVHEPAVPTWSQCLAQVSRLMDDQLDVRRVAWRVHLLSVLDGVPGATGVATVAVLQVSHALADGVRSSALAAYLFGRDQLPPTLVHGARHSMVPAMIEARRRRRELGRDVLAGLAPRPRALVPPLSTNEHAGGSRSLRTLIRRRSELPDATVTVGVLGAISEALSGHFADRGEDIRTLTAAVSVVKMGARDANNYFDNVMVGLQTDAVSRDERLALIDAEFEERRRARLHPSVEATERAFDATPAPLRRLGVRLLDTEKRPKSVVAHTVLSSVNRGPADLSLGGCGVLFTSGYPELLPICGLTHGVHGIGDTVAISVHASDAAVPDIDAYLDRLNGALGGVDGAVRPGRRNLVM